MTDLDRTDSLIRRLALCVLGEDHDEITLTAVLELAATMAERAGTDVERACMFLRTAMEKVPTRERGQA